MIILKCFRITFFQAQINKNFLRGGYTPPPNLYLLGALAPCYTPPMAAPSPSVTIVLILPTSPNQNLKRRPWIVKKWKLNIHFEKCHVFLVYCLTRICLSGSIYFNVSKSSRTCNLIYANIKCADMLVLVNFYKCYARPLLEYCSVIFSPHHVYLIKLTESVQKNLPKNCLDCEICVIRID